MCSRELNVNTEPSRYQRRTAVSKAVREGLRAGRAGLLFTLLASSGAWGQSGFPAVVELSALDGSDGFVINGIDAGDRSGRSVSAAGDINGDGVGDVIIGAGGADPSGNNGAGESYVVFGSGTVGVGGELELSALDGSDGFVINGIDVSDGSGGSVSAAGDINGDGVDDVIIGARGGDPSSNGSAGESYVLFGGSFVGIAGRVDAQDLDGSDGFVINGIDVSDGSGISVSAAGDINGDGADDVIIGAFYGDPSGNSYSGESYVVFGSGTVGVGGELELSALDGSDGFVINGIDTFDYSGISVSAAGDINGDGVDDVIIGAFYGDPSGNSGAGESYVVIGGGLLGASGQIELSGLDGSDGFVVNGIDAFDYSGGSVSAAGDINGDGVDDVIIGARGADSNGNSYAGESYVVFGSSSVGGGGELELSELDGSDGLVINGIDVADGSGTSVSAAGDINGDGVDDVIIGARLADPRGDGAAGESYVVFGSGTVGVGGELELSALDGSEGFVINGIDASDNSGRSVSAAGDINGDGVDDVIIGAYRADPSGNSDAGESYVLFGQLTGEQCNGLTVTVNLNLGQTTTPDADVVLGTSGADDIRGKAGNDTICGKGGDDFIHGNSGNDWIDGGGGVDNLRGGQGDDVIYTGSGSTVGTSSRAFGGTGDDEINGGSDADDLRGGRGMDTINGNDGDDVITGNDDGDMVNGGRGFDTVKGGNGDDDVRGGADDDVLNGGAGDDVLNGGGGSSDFCDGGSGTGDTATASCEMVTNVP